MIDRRLAYNISQLGLSAKEAAAYISLLSLGTSTASKISKESSLNRATTYVVLDVLEKKNLIKISISEKGHYYTALSPESFLTRLETQANEAANKLEKARSLLPALSMIYFGAGNRQKVTLYNGIKGIENVYEDTLTSSETIRAFASIDNMHEALPHYFPAYYARRAAKNIHIRSIHPDSAKALERIAHDTVELRTSCLVPEDNYDFSPEINIYDNKVAFMSLQEKFGLIVESREISDAMKKIFELSWAQANHLNAQEEKSVDS